MFTRIGTAFFARRGINAPWGLIAVLKLIVLFGAVAVVLRSDFASPVGFLVGYLALPIDLVPDFLPGIGQLDDAVLLGLVLRLVVRGGGGQVVRESWPGPQASLTLVLRAAGLETNGAATPPTTL